MPYAESSAWAAYLAKIAHEVRGPLHSMLGLAQLLADETPGPLNAEQQRIVGDISSTAGRLLRVANDLVDLSRLRNDSLEFELEVISLASVVKQATQLARGLAHPRGITLEVQVDARMAVHADEGRVLQVLHNLLSNAIHYCPAGSLVRVSAEPAPAVVWTLVEDNGHGIHPDDQERIFEPFVSVKCGEAERGSGLGLAICKRMVEAMHGAIEVESTPGEGACFRFSLPRAEAPV